MGERTKTEFEIFNELVRDLSLVGIAAELGECQFLVRSARRFKPVEVYSISSHDDNRSDDGTHVYVESLPSSRTMGPPTMIAV